MPIQYSDVLSSDDYFNRLKAFLILEEGESFAPYVDTQGVPTIGWGFAIGRSPALSRTVKNVIQNVIGVNHATGLTELAREREVAYEKQLRDVLNQAWPADNTIHHTGSSSTLNSALNAILVARANEISNPTSARYTRIDAALIGVPATAFTYTDVDQEEDTLKVMLPEYERRVDSVFNSLDAVIPNTKERIALFGMVYNGLLARPSATGAPLAGRELAARIIRALQQPDPAYARAAAWYEIRYRNAVSGAKRAYMESALFGLYNDQDHILQSDAQAVFRMLNEHRNTILSRDASNTTAISDAYNGLNGTATLSSFANAVRTRDVFQSGLAAFVAYANTLRGDNAPVITIAMISNPTSIYYSSDTERAIFDAGDYDNKYGAGTPNSLLVGGVSDDVMAGGAGNDYLLGMAGNDNLDGGAGNDTLVGGAGDDVYIFDMGNGNDMVVDQREGDGRQHGLLRIEDSLAAGVFIKEESGSSWKSVDGKFTLTGNTLTSVYGNTITLTDFVDGDFGIHLVETPEPPKKPKIDPPATGRTILGDYKPASPATSDDLGNPTLDLSQPVPGRADKLNDSSGNDSIDSGSGNDTINAVSGGNDYIKAGEGSDIVDAGEGEDLVEGGKGDDLINGGGGRDRIDAGEGKDTVDGGNEVDLIEGGKDEDTIKGGKGDDWIGGGSEQDLIKGGDGDDVLFGGDIDEEAVKKGLDFGGATTDGKYGDFINGGLNNDLIVGSDKADALVGDDGDDRILGGAGHDFIFGDSSYDSSTIEFKFREQSEAYAAADENAPGFSSGIGLTSTGLTGNHEDGTGKDTIYGGSGGDMVWGGKGNDLIFGESGVDALNGEDGNDTIYGGDDDDGIMGGADDDYIDLGGGNLHQQALGGSGADTVIGGNTDDYLYGDAGNDYLDGKGGIDHIQGGGGNDIIIGGDGIDFLYGGENDDVYMDIGIGDFVLDIEGNNVFMFDFAFERPSGGGVVSSSSTESASLASRTMMAVSDVAEGATSLASVSEDGIALSLAADQITLQVDLGEGFMFNVQNALFGTQADLQFSNGEKLDFENLVATRLMQSVNLQQDDAGGRLYGGAGFDMLHGGTGSDTLAGHLGNDTLFAGTGDDVYEYAAGDGDDTILDTGGTDVLRFLPGIVPANVSVKRNGNYLVLMVNTDASFGNIYVADYFSNADGSTRIERIEFADGTAWTYADIKAFMPKPTVGNDSLSGYAESDVIDGLDGNDLILGYDSDDTLRGGAGDDSLQGGRGADLLEGGAGNDRIYGYDNGNDADRDTLAGGVGKDSMYGGQGDDVYLFGRGDGSDWILEMANTGGAASSDVLRLGSGVLPANVALYRTGSLGNDLTVVIDGSADQIVVSDYFRTGSDAQIERIEFDNGAGAVWLAADIASRVQSGTPNAMTGTSANNTFTVDDERDTITEAAGGGIDTVLADRSFVLSANVENLTLTGVLNSTAVGNELDNVLRGNVNDNILDGQGGNDTAYGGKGDDVYINVEQIVELAGEGNDTWINAAGGTLGANVENLDMRSSTWSRAPSQAIGNSLNNVLISGWYGDTLDGAAGADTMIAGYGNETVYVDNVGDRIVGDFVGTVASSIDYELAPNYDNLRLMGFSAIAGRGNARANSLDGATNTAANVLTGLGGDDTYFLGQGDQAIEAADGGYDTVWLSDGAWYYEMEGKNIEKVELGFSATGTVIGSSGNDYLVGQGTLSGGAGDDTLEGGGTLRGGTGDDVYRVGSNSEESPAGILENVDEGHDSIYFTSAYFENYMPDNLEDAYSLASGTRIVGNAGDNRIEGDNGNNRLDGGAGRDTLIGGNGNDSYVLDDAGDIVVEEADGGFDWVTTTVDYELSDNVEALQLMGENALVATGNALNNTLYGNELNNELYGLGGDDYLYGGLGSDTLTGDSGNDTYMFYAGDGNDVIIDTDGTAGNVDQLSIQGVSRSDLSFSRSGDDLQVRLRTTGEVITVKSWFASDDNKIELFDINGEETLDAATVTLLGNNRAPVVASPLPDRTTNEDAAFSFTIPTTSFADPDAGDVLTYGAKLASGGALPSWLAFNATTRTLSGTPTNANVGFFDVRVTATDKGGASVTDIFRITVVNTNDAPVVSVAVPDQTGKEGLAFSYVVPASSFSDVDVGDVLSYAATLSSGAALPSWLGFNASTRTFSGTPPTGSAGTLTINIKATDLAGASATDAFLLVVAPAVNVINGTSAAEKLTGTSADDRISGLAGNDTLIGNAGNDTLDGGAGNDSMTGGTGNDIYVVDSTSDIVVENSGEGTDFVQAGVTWTLGSNVENLTLTGTSAINGTGNTLANVLTGNAAANTLDGGTGADTMTGGAGDDTYVVDNAADVVNENAGEGIDLVKAGVTWTLGGNVENLTLTGSNTINGTGNTLDNVLTGNSAVNTLTGAAGNDTLDGGSGADSLVGGAGDDVYVVDNTGDKVVENASEGTDIVKSSVTFTLGSNVENLTLTGSSAINGTGNTLDNVLIGNSAVNTLTGAAGNDTLDGGSGADSLVGGAGNDVYVVDNTSDKVTENASEGTDLVQSSVTWTLGSNVENLTLTGSSAINGTGNTLDNVLIGNSAVNTLTGAAGNDTLDGGAGADSLVGGAGNDVYIVDNTSDKVTENASEGTDLVQSSVTWTLGTNVENLTLTGTSAISGTGNTGNNLLIGNSAANTLTGAAGNDTLDGGAGSDSLVGGTGNDVYVLGRGYATDTISENDSTSGNTDVLQAATDVAASQLWFVKNGNNLEISIIGTSDKAIVTNWYLGNQYHVEQIKSGDGKLLLDSQVQNLVGAMAAFAPPGAGQTTLPSSYQSSLNPVIAANWH